MKKTISICLLCAMLLSAVACAEKQEETISDQTSEQLSTAEPEEEAGFSGGAQKGFGQSAGLRRRGQTVHHTGAA